MKKLLIIVVVIFATLHSANARDRVKGICKIESCALYETSKFKNQIGAITLNTEFDIIELERHSNIDLIRIRTPKFDTAWIAKREDISVVGDFTKKGITISEKLKEYFKLQAEIKTAYYSLPSLKATKFSVIDSSDSGFYLLNSEGNIRIHKKTTGIGDCTGEPLTETITQQGVIEYSSSTFFIKDFPILKNGLKVGLTQDEVKLLFGVPYRESEKMITYVKKEHRQTAAISGKKYVEPYRLYFKNNKLIGIWIKYNWSC